MILNLARESPMSGPTRTPSRRWHAISFRAAYTALAAEASTRSRRAGEQHPPPVAVRGAASVHPYAVPRRLVGLSALKANAAAVPLSSSRNDVEPQVGPREQAPDRGADGDGRVEGRSRHLAAGECARQDREADSETEVGIPVCCVGRGHVQHDVHQRKREKELGQKRPKYGGKEWTHRPPKGEADDPGRTGGTEQLRPPVWQHVRGRTPPPQEHPERGRPTCGRPRRSSSSARPLWPAEQSRPEPLRSPCSRSSTRERTSR